jgi:hypothetical protein
MIIASSATLCIVGAAAFSFIAVGLVAKRPAIALVGLVLYAVDILAQFVVFGAL